MASVQANDGNWHCRLDLAPGNNEISVSGSWVFDPGRPPIGPGGNGTVAKNGGQDGFIPKPDFVFVDGRAGEGCLLVRQSGGGITSYFTDSGPIYLTGSSNSYVEFVMNDNNHSDNSGSLEVSIRAVP